ncbi:PEBP-like protein [Sparassis crispa]|uniref:PEBP-like protein n=1 Tax=Sparassis crispa TaxID=139825 RepID=A0A401GD09_9APHY|nr:PEBP-like protein [Sparassis crispa]GBE80003.1 PEBP-like protein [Sparassis crispa]
MDAKIVPNVIPTFDPIAVLNVAFKTSNSTIGVTPATNLTVEQTAQPPSFALTSSNTTLDGQTFVIVMIDPDAPTPTNTSWSLVRHILAGDFHASGNFSLGAPLTNSSAAITPFIAPGPPAGSPPHRYIQLLFIQPPNFDTLAPEYVNTSSSIPARLDWNLTSFSKEVGLGSPVAGNFFYTGPDASNASSSSTSSAPSSTSSPSAAKGMSDNSSLSIIFATWALTALALGLQVLS